MIRLQETDNSAAIPRPGARRALADGCDVTLTALIGAGRRFHQYEDTPLRSADVYVSFRARTPGNAERIARAWTDGTQTYVDPVRFDWWVDRLRTIAGFHGLADPKTIPAHYTRRLSSPSPIQTYGYAYGTRPDGDTEIRGLFCNARGGGWGNLALAEAIQAIGETPGIVLDCYAYLQAFYERHGFVVMRREAAHDPRMPDVLWMRRAG